MVEEDSKIKDLVGFTEEELLEAYGVYGSALVRKTEMYDEISKLAEELIEAKNDEKSHLGDLWLCTIWSEVIEGKATDKTKGAYVGEHIRPFKAECERIQNKIDDCWRNIDVINTFLKLGGIDD